MRRPHNKQELVHYIPPESSPLNVSRIWLVQQSLHLQTLQLSLPSSQTQTFTLTSPLSSIHITPSLSQSVSSVLNRSSDSSTSSLTWSEVSTNEQKVQRTSTILDTNAILCLRLSLCPSFAAPFIWDIQQPLPPQLPNPNS